MVQNLHEAIEQKWRNEGKEEHHRSIGTLETILSLGCKAQSRVKSTIGYFAHPTLATATSNNGINHAESPLIYAILYLFLSFCWLSPAHYRRKSESQEPNSQTIKQSTIQVFQYHLFNYGESVKQPSQPQPQSQSQPQL